jgi:hypothetical protein
MKLLYIGRLKILGKPFVTNGPHTSCALCEMHDKLEEEEDRPSKNRRGFTALMDPYTWKSAVFIRCRIGGK